MESQKFYELKFAGRQVLLRVRAPEQGRKANLSDIQRELRQRDVEYRHEILFEIYRRASNEFEPLSQHESREYEVRVEVSEDAQQAWLTVVPPDLGQASLSPAQIKEALEGARVEKGILYDEIRRVLREQVENEKVLIAEGRPRVHGQDGTVEFVVETNEGPVVEENRVDFRELNLIKNVNADDLIALVHPPVAGQDGYDVHARTLKARPGRKARLKLGRNVKLGESGSEIFASKDGYVVRTGERVSVENVLELANVDAETGNIRFHGVVRVMGQVEDAYTVEAEKGIEVDGTVGKATLTTKGDLRVHGGAIGATLTCEGNVYARFLSESTVKAGEDVIVDDYILHSTVEAGRAVRVNAEPKGFITGGVVKAGSEVVTPILGAEVSEVHTALEVGSGVDVRKQYEALAERMEANVDAFDKLRKNLTYLQKRRESEEGLQDDQEEMFGRMMGSGQKLRDELLAQVRLHHKWQRSLQQARPETALVLVSEVAHPGVTLSLQRIKHTLTERQESCAFTVLSGAFKVLPYGAALKLHKQLKTQQAQSAR